ncbi:hypothetical protein BURK2_03089 [Burkholderiales bacterium]|nr:MAG: hypothetical protein F9K47_08600 [Burkholderiales bacterium]CAG1001854.1 hypothetical protein BURK2_03089 [Burkholderiales bacterium]
MNKIDLSELARRESEQVEWKLNVADIEDVLATITAFANDFQNLGGGYVVCGAEETKDEHGFQKVRFPGLSASRFKEIEGKVISDSRARIDPPVTPLVEELNGESEDGRVLVFIVPASGHSHSYRASGKDSSTYYIRLGRSTVEARNGVLRELLVRKGDQLPWDSRLCEKASLADIDLIAFREVLQEAGLWNASIGVDEYFSEELHLSALAPSLGGKRPMDADIHPRNFAILLFGRQPTKFFPGAWTKVSIYPGMDRSEPTSERHELMGSIVDQARRARDLLNTHSSTAFTKESPDPNTPKYPARALEEALINAIVHRDYELTDPTSITIFSNRVEVLSPGSLPRTVDRKKFLEGRAAPSWRNRSLAFFFNRLQLAQAEGQGIPTIFRTMKQLGSPAPSFDLDEASLTCVLPAHPRHEMLRQLGEIQRLLVQQDVDLAMEKLLPILETSPAAPQVLDLYCQIAHASKSPERVANHVRNHRISMEDLPARTVFQIAGAMAGSQEVPDRELAKMWIQEVSKRKLEADETKSAFIALRNADQNEEAVQLINRFVASHPSPLAIPAFLYDMRGKAKIDLAKKCMDTGRNREVDGRTKTVAWDQCRKYLDEAESDIRRALQMDPDSRDRGYFQKDLEFVQRMKENARKPPPRPNRGKPRRS